MAITTDTLKGRISHADSFPDVMEKNSGEFVEISVSDYLNALCRKRGIRPAEAIRRAHIERTYGCQIFNGTRVPSRDKLLQIAVGMGLSLDDTQDLLKKSGKNPLYPRIKRDAACMFALTHGMNTMEVQELLASVDLPLLGGV